MIGSNILLFPDTGPEFLKSAKTAALYSEHVHVLTILDETILGIMESDAAEVIANEPEPHPRLYSPIRMLKYADFMREHGAGLRLLESEGVLSSFSRMDNWFLALSYFSQVTLALGGDLERTNIITGQIGTLLIDVMEVMPSSYSDMLSTSEEAITNRDEEHRKQIIEVCGGPVEYEHLWQQGNFHLTKVLSYIAGLTLLAEQQGVGLCTWSPVIQNALWAYRKTITTADKYASKIGVRHSIEAQLGHCVLERYIPSVDDLPFEEILSIRRKRAPELAAFRSGLAELATQIDVAQLPHDIELQVSDIVANNIDPAVRDLQAALYSSRLDALTKIGQNYTSLAGALIPAALTVSAGAPLNVTAALAALGGSIGAVTDSIVQSKKLLHASQWSLLLNLGKIGVKNPTPQAAGHFQKRLGLEKFEL